MIEEEIHPRDNVHPAEGAAAVDPALANANTLAMLIAGHVIQDDEIIILLLKPSLWLIVISSLPFSALVTIIAIATILWTHIAIPVQSAILLISLRVAYSTLMWMNRFYILTDRRVIRLSGIWRVEIFACPLRRIARTRVLQVLPERALGIGHIEIIPQDEQLPIALWQCVSRPRRVHEQILDAIRRARGPQC
jgi:hypothetical protein